MQKPKRAFVPREKDIQRQSSTSTRKSSGPIKVTVRNGHKVEAHLVGSTEKTYSK